jgi:acetaldehyde dehydrogenase/alcohol dehydrogenase
MPHVIRYNAQQPTKFTSFPKYDHFIADQRYAEIAKFLGLPADSVEQGVQSLIDAIRVLNRSLKIPESFVEMGLDQQRFDEMVDELADRAFEDQCTVANPRYPLVTELAEVYRKAFYGDFS